MNICGFRRFDIVNGNCLHSFTLFSGKLCRFWRVFMHKVYLVDWGSLTSELFAILTQTISCCKWAGFEVFTCIWFILPIGFLWRQSCTPFWRRPLLTMLLLTMRYSLGYRGQRWISLVPVCSLGQFWWVQCVLRVQQTMLQTASELPLYHFFIYFLTELQYKNEVSNS